MKRILAILLFVTASASAAIQSPSQFLGFEVGADRTLADYKQIVSYFRALAAASPRVQVESLGKTTLGEDFIMAIISSESNMRNLPRIRAIAKQLADPRGLSNSQIDSLIHDTVLLLIPSLNPDGENMITDYYRKYLGTRYEGGRLPWLYHHYVGHDNNRDWYMLTQIETKEMSHAVYQEWYPQVWVDEH